VLNRQREAIYSDRRHILAGDDLTGRVDTFLVDVVNDIVNGHIADNAGSDWDLEALWGDLRTIYPIGLTVEEVLTEAGSRSKLTRAWLANEIVSDARLAYSRRVNQVGEVPMHELERRVVLSVLDRKWRDHLYEMDYLKEGIGLRAMAQRDPLVEYQREGYNMFNQMMGAIKEESIGFLFNLDVQVEPQLPSTPSNLTFSAPSESGDTEVKAANQDKPKDEGPGSSFFKK
jgi:preprotein translocase subunit SecA